MEDHTPHAQTVRRAALPEVMFAPDVALALGVTPSAARKLIRRGFPHVRIGRRLAVRRDAFLETIAASEVVPEVPLGPPPAPKPKPEYLKLLRRHRGEGGAR